MGHALAECSDAGICNRDNGICECFEGYDGAACEKTACLDNCNGHGRCLSMQEAATATNAVPLVCYPTKYEGNEATTTWDSDMIHGCVCDSSWSVGYGNGETQLGEWFGNACQYKRCPSGNDPLTLGNDQDCQGLWDNGQTFGTTVAITFVAVSGSGTSGVVTFTELIPAVVPFKVGSVVVIVDLPTTTALNNAWTVTAATTTTFSFVPMERSFASDNTYNEAGSAHDCKGSAGNLCHVECSNRGKCDYEKGTCDCVEGYTGEACENVVAVLFQ